MPDFRLLARSGRHRTVCSGAKNEGSGHWRQIVVPVGDEQPEALTTVLYTQIEKTQFDQGIADLRPGDGIAILTIRFDNDSLRFSVRADESGGLPYMQVKEVCRIINGDWVSCAATSSYYDFALYRGLAMSDTKSQTFLRAGYNVTDHYMGGRNEIALSNKGRESWTQGLLWIGTVDKQVGELFTDENTRVSPLIRNGDMFGSCSVKDLSGNDHFFATAYNYRTEKRHYHVEDWLKRDINKFWAKEAKLTAAKVSFYFWQSPCPGCTDHLENKWLKEMVGKITGNSDSKRVFFVFNFHEYYKPENPKPDQKRWEDDDQAKRRFRELSQSFGMTDPIAGRKGTYQIPIVNFRKSSTETFSGISGKRYT